MAAACKAIRVVLPRADIGLVSPGRRKDERGVNSYNQFIQYMKVSIPVHGCILPSTGDGSLSSQME